ncbi:MAG: hypothetical protein ACR2PO_04930 [Methyloligellaceae bacterium]
MTHILRLWMVVGIGIQTLAGAAIVASLATVVLNGFGILPVLF